MDTQYMQKPPQSTSLYTFIGTQPSSLNIAFFSLLMSSNISLINKTTSTLTDGSISIDDAIEGCIDGDPTGWRSIQFAA